MEQERSVNEMSGQDMEGAIDLIALFWDFFKILRKFWWLFGLLVAAAAVCYSAYTYLQYKPQYRSHATFTVVTNNSQSGSYGYYYAKNTADQLSRTFPYILQSSYFEDVLLEELGVAELNGKISAETVSNSNMITMAVVSPNAEDAKAILEAALTVYPNTARFVLGETQFHMLNNPELPTAPYNKPTATQTLGLGLLLGVLLGVAVLGVMVLLRKTAKTPEQMKSITNIKCLAAVPVVKLKARKSKKQKRISVLDPRISFGYRESLRSLQIRLERALRENDGKVVLVTSTAPGEGKSTISINLAESLAAKGKKVLLIDADLWKQEDAKILGCGDGMGLQDLFRKDRVDSQGLRKLPQEDFWFIGSTRVVKNPAKVLSHPGLASFMATAKKQMDYIIIDTPPCAAFQDAVLLQEYADATVYVVKHDFVTVPQIQEGLAALRQDKNHYVGYVFNAYAQGMSDYGYGRYGYGYGKYGYGRGYGYGYGRSEDVKRDRLAR